MTPLFHLLSACCRWPDDEERRCAIREAAAPIRDWTGLLALAERHRVEPLVANGLEAAGLAVPEALSGAVEAHRDATIRDLAEMLRIASALDQQAIPHRFLKGIPLGIAAYGSPTLKRSWDVDVLVVPRDAVAAAACLARLDYAPIVPPRPLDADEFARWSVVSKEAELRSPRGTTVELHWRVSDHPDLLAPIDASSPARRIAVFGNNDVTVLADGPNLAYLAVHGGAHGWHRLKWIADFNALLQSLSTSQRRAALAEARVSRPGRALDAALALADVLFHNQPRHTDDGAAGLTRLSLAALASGSDRRAATLAAHARWRLKPGLSYRANELRVRLRGTLDRAEHPLPRVWWFLYPVMRFPFGIKRALGRAWRRGARQD